MGSYAKYKKRPLDFIMKNKMILLFIYFFSFATSFLHGREADLQSMINNKKPGKYLDYYEDKPGKITIDSIISDNSLNWIKSREENLGFGFSDSALWFKFTVVNSSGQDLDWYLVQTFPVISSLKLYYPSIDNDYIEISTGSQLNYSERPVDYRSFAFPIKTLAGKENTIYLFCIICYRVSDNNFNN